MNGSIVPPPPSFPSLVQQSFTEYLVTQRAVSPQTVASYRDAWMLFLDFAHQRLGKPPTALRLVDIEPDLILAFLKSFGVRAAEFDSELQPAADGIVGIAQVCGAARRVIVARQRAGTGHPNQVLRATDAWLPVAQRDVGGDREPGDSWTSQRDHLLLALFYDIGARVSVIISVRVADVVFEGAPCVHVHGKGRKQRTTPLRTTTIRKIRA